MDHDILQLITNRLRLVYHNAVLEIEHPTFDEGPDVVIYTWYNNGRQIYQLIEDEY